MKFFLISDNVDTLVGMRLAGVEGVVVHERDELFLSIEKALSDRDIGVLLITEKLTKLAPEQIRQMKLSSRRPLLVEIPDRHADSNIAAEMEAYISEAIGVKF